MNRVRQMESELAEYACFEGAVMGLLRRNLVGRKYRELTPQELELMEFATSKNWVQVGVHGVTMLKLTPEELHVDLAIARDQDRNRRLTEPAFRVLWPDDMLVTGEQLMRWASDDVDNELCELPKPMTVEEAINILQETGSVTLGEG